MTGVAEAGYEEFEFLIDNELMIWFQAPHNVFESCEEGTCKMCNVSMGPHEISLSEGNHTIQINVHTVDEFYHKNAFYRINFSIKKEDGCKACKCPTEGI